MKQNIFSFALISTLFALTGCSLSMPKNETKLNQASPQLNTRENTQTSSALPVAVDKSFKVKGIAGPTLRTMLSPINTRVVYETYAQVNIQGTPQNIYYEYFMEPPITLNYRNTQIPAAFMTRRLNDGEKTSEVRLLLGITQGQCDFKGGTITELDPVTYEAKSPEKLWVFNRMKPLGRALYDKNVETQNVLATEICAGYSPQFLEYKLK